MRRSVALLSVAAGQDVFVPSVFSSVEDLEKDYSARQSVACNKVRLNAPSLADTEGFLAAYQKFDGNETEGAEAEVLSLASALLPQVDAFLSLSDSFESGGLDSSLVECAVLLESTPKGLAAFAAQGQAQEDLVDQLLNDAVLMRDMLIAGGAKGGKYGEAMEILDKLMKASTVLGHEMLQARRMATGFLSSATPWDDRAQGSILNRLALGTALELAVPWKHKYVDSDTYVDPVQRYLHYEKAYLAGNLDPAFEVLTAFECRYVIDTDAIDEDLLWMRETLANLRPDHIATGNMHWRYAMATRTEVSYGHTIWPEGYAPDYKMLPAADAVCGGRAWFARLARKAFGLPTWGVQQPGHAAMTTWGPDGWAVLLGADWKFSYWQHTELLANRGGPDFHLESQVREHRLDFQKVSRMQWVAAALNEDPVDARWTPTNPKSYGKGGVWSALTLYLKKITMNEKGPAPSREIGSSQVQSKVEKLSNKWSQKLPVLPITTGDDGTITIPATSYSKGKSVTRMWSMNDDGQQLMHSGGSVSKPDSTAFEYEVTVDKEDTYFLTVNMTTWHMNADLLLTTTASANQTNVPMYFTLGYWNETQPLEVKLLKGKNVLRFTRMSKHDVSIKEFMLFKTKPIIPTPDQRAVPIPTPALSDYIELPQGKTCVSQGILTIEESECEVACEYMGYKYSGARQRPWLSPGCFSLAASSEWAGNCNFNSNTSAHDYDPDIRAICLRN